MGTAFYQVADAFLQRPAAEALVRAHAALAEHGYGVIVHDGYRPWRVTKMFFDATPEHQRIFVADPSAGSRHNRGAAVDIGLYDRATGEVQVFVSGYDEFSERAFPRYVGGTSEQRWLRELLRQVMEGEGFDVYEHEWWHFDYRGLAALRTPEHRASSDRRGGSRFVILDLLSREGRQAARIRRAAKTLTERYAQPEPRMDAAERLVRIGTPEAIYQLARRFTITSGNLEQDDQEKRWVRDLLVEQGEPVVAPLRRYIKGHDEITWADGRALEAHPRRGSRGVPLRGAAGRRSGGDPGGQGGPDPRLPRRTRHGGDWITAFGIWVGRRDRSVAGFFLAGRSAPFWAVAACVVATETSVLTFTSVPGFAYEGNFGFLQLAIGFLLGRVGIAMVLLPAYFRGEVVTTYELLLKRFGTRVRSAAAAIFLVYRNLADGVRLHAAALMVAIVAGVPEWWCIVALAAAMVVFSEEGGVKATIWTDVIQLGVYLIGAGVVVAALWQGSGPEPLAWIPAAREAGKFAVALPAFDLTIPYTLWAGVIGGFFLTFATHGADQYLAQRLLAARSLRHAQAGLVLSGVGALFQFALFLGIGAWLWHYYGGREFARPDEVLPTFVAENISGAAAGITLAAVVAAALSPSLVSLASTTVRDFWLPWKRRRGAAAEPPMRTMRDRSGWAASSWSSGESCRPRWRSSRSGRRRRWRPGSRSSPTPRVPRWGPSCWRSSSRGRSRPRC